MQRTKICIPSNKLGNFCCASSTLKKIQKTIPAHYYISNPFGEYNKTNFPDAGIDKSHDCDYIYIKHCAG